MPLRLEIVSKHRELVGDDAVFEFGEAGGTIGRSLKNDWILPDPDRYISGQHATVDCRGGIYYLADVSSNGVYVNDDAEPIGKGNPRRLFNGDRLFFGDFEIAVTVDEGEDLDMPEPPKPSVAPDNIEQFVPEVTLKTGVALLDEEEITGDDAFQSVVFGGGNRSGNAAAPVAAEATGPGKPAPLPAPRAVERSDDELFDAFLDGLGVNREDLHPSLDVATVMRNAGEVLREYVTGIQKLLASRAELKTAFSLDQTAILPKYNNPLKLSQNAEDSIRQLLVGGDGEYLGPRDAVRQVCGDLLSHHDAFLDAMTSAFVDFAERFNPDEVIESCDRTNGGKSLFAFMRDGKYWQHYVDLYPVITDKGEGRFPETFAEEFVKAYELAVAEALRPAIKAPLNDTQAMLAKTQKLDRSDAIANDDSEAEDEEIREPTLEEEIAALPDPEQAEA